MEPNWDVSKDFFVRMCMHVTQLNQQTYRSKLKLLRESASVEEAGNLFFPVDGVFGCDFALAHALKYQINGPDPDF